jgi:hypothetical protein
MQVREPPSCRITSGSGRSGGRRVGSAIWIWQIADDEDSVATKVLGASFGGLFLGGVIAVVSNTLIERALPGFEVVRPGERGRGAWVVGLIGTLFLFLVGIAASAVLN